MAGCDMRECASEMRYKGWFGRGCDMRNKECVYVYVCVYVCMCI